MDKKPEFNGIVGDNVSMSTREVMVLHQLIHIAMEEPSEIQKVLSKIGRFGPHQPNPVTGKYPLKELHEEFNDFVGAVELVAEHLNVPSVYVDRDLVDRKKRKINHFLSISEEMGMMGRLDSIETEWKE